MLLGLTPWLKRWDKRHALAADGYLANSRVVRDRMREAYGIEAPVLPAPHAMDPAAPQEPVAALDGWHDYYLVVSRLLPYKNVEAAVEAFRDLREQLVVVGHGPLKRSLERRLPANVRLLSNLTDAQLRWVYAHSRALVAPSLEDYGLTPLEAAAYGKPTLALGAGGYLDTVVPGTTGIFFGHPTPREIRDAVLAARSGEWSRPQSGTTPSSSASRRSTRRCTAPWRTSSTAERRRSTRARSPRRLVRALALGDRENRPPEDLEVLDEVPVLDVVEVEAYRVVPREVAAATDLPETGHPGLHQQPPVDVLLVQRDLRGQRRARPDEAHLAAQRSIAAAARRCWCDAGHGRAA